MSSLSKTNNFSSFVINSFLFSSTCCLVQMKNISPSLILERISFGPSCCKQKIGLSSPCLKKKKFDCPYLLLRNFGSPLFPKKKSDRSHFLSENSCLPSPKKFMSFFPLNSATSWKILIPTLVALLQKNPFSSLFVLPTKILPFPFSF